MTATRRTLTFQSLDEIVSEIERLQTGGYDRAGAWNLGQICGHLNHWMKFPMDGFPKPPLVIRLMLWMMKVTVAKKQLKRILESGFKPGIPTMPETVPPAEPANDEAQVAEFKATIDRFQNHSGPIHPSPLFGEMDYVTARQIQLAHCAHHLGFLVPKA